MKKLMNVSFDKVEITLWIISSIMLVGSFLFSQSSVLLLIVTWIGVTALLYLAKGEPLGQILTIIFSMSYAIISFELKYYSETITYAFMTLPSAVLALISWLKHPYEKEKATVKIGAVQMKQFIFIVILTLLVTMIFHILLRLHNTPYIYIATLSITTSFLAAMFMIFRSRYYALFYAANDVVLMLLWGITFLDDTSYLPLFICFLIFFVHDLYAFFNWKVISIKQLNVTNK